MIKISSDIIDKAIRHLEKHYPCEDDVYVKILEGFDTVMEPGGKMGFGVYATNERAIYIAGDLPDDEYAIVTTVAHEYKHFLQHMSGEEFDEKDAVEFGEKIYMEMKKEERRCF